MIRNVGVTVGFLILAALPAAASEVSKGQFDLYLNGVKKGTERYKIEIDKKRMVENISSEMRFQLPVPKAKRGYVEMILTPSITRSAQTGEFFGYEYRLDFNDFTDMELVETESSAREYIDQQYTWHDPMSVTSAATQDEMEGRIDLGVNAGALQRLGNVLHFKQTKFSATRIKDEPFVPDLEVLDAYAFCLYIPLARKAAAMEGNSMSFRTAVPQAMRMRPGRLEFMGVEKTPFAGKTLILKHFDILLEESVWASLWLDKAGTLVQIAVPAEGILAVRSKITPVPFESESPRLVRETVAMTGNFQEKQVSVASGGIAIGGSFVLPGGEGKRPAVLLVQDLTASDRDGRVPAEGERGGTFLKQMAFYLAENGFCSLRTDARGIGTSGGSQETVTPEERVADVSSLLAWLRAQPGVDPSRVAVLAYGTGGWIAGKALTPESARALVSVGFPAKEFPRLLREQVAQIADPQERQAAYNELERLAEQSRTAEEWGSFRGRKVYLPAYRSLAAIQPLDILGSLSLPALLAYPEMDLVVLPFHRELLPASLKPNQTSQVLPGAGHHLQGVDEDGLSKTLLHIPACQTVVQWLEKTLGLPPAGP